MNPLAFAALLAAALLLAPATAAQLYDRDSDPYFGTVHEPDGAIVHAPGSGLDGIGDRGSNNLGTGSSSNGLPAGWGDGSTILDSQFYMSLAGQILLGHYAAADGVRGSGQFMWPGHGQFFAWHGEWNDLDNDGRIDDAHDALDPEVDEFRWRGAARGETIEMPVWITPYGFNVNNEASATRTTLPTGDGAGFSPSATHDRTSVAPNGQFLDRTGLDSPEQGWMTATLLRNLGHTWLDDGFLVTTFTIVAADPVSVPGSEMRYDLARPGMLVDVDRYDSLNPDVETLYLAATAGWSDLVRGIYRDSWDNVVAPTIAQARAWTDEVGTAPAAFVLEPRRAPREPNHASDSYPGATWSGADDIIGTGSDFTGHAEGWHLYADVRHSYTVPVPGRIDVRPLGVDAGLPNLGSVGFELTPSRESGGNAQRNSAPGLVMFSTDVVLWKDLNRDKWVGERCDPEEPAEWDAEAGECLDPYNGGLLFQAHNYLHAHEAVGACWSTDLRNGEIELVPLTPWDGVYVVRDARSLPTRYWDTGNPLVLEGPFNGLEVLTLRQNPECTTSRGDAINSRDGLLMPTGSLGNAFLSRAVITLTAEVHDENLGIDLLPGQAVVDVDHIPAAL